MFVYNKWHWNVKVWIIFSSIFHVLNLSQMLYSWNIFPTFLYLKIFSKNLQSRVPRNTIKTRINPFHANLPFLHHIGVKRVNVLSAKLYVKPCQISMMDLFR